MSALRNAPVAAVDGPSGVGKGTLCRWLAERLGWHLLDSGALYRLTALAALRRGLQLDQGPSLSEPLAELARTLDVSFQSSASTGTENASQILLQGQPVTDEIRSEACGNAASQVAVLPAVREALLNRQRDFRRPPGLIADGRDMGTVVFPDANVKIFLIASAEERAKRRYKQLKEKGMDASLAALVENIAERDARDAGRAVAPLQAAPDAVVLDSTGLSIDDVRRRALTLLEQFLN